MLHFLQSIWFVVITTFSFIDWTVCSMSELFLTDLIFLIEKITCPVFYLYYPGLCCHLSLGIIILHYLNIIISIDLFKYSWYQSSRIAFPSGFCPNIFFSSLAVNITASSWKTGYTESKYLLRLLWPLAIPQRWPHVRNKAAFLTAFPLR
jgi:hypothetical protein